MKKLNLLRWSVGVIFIPLALVLTSKTFVMAQGKKPKPMPSAPSEQAPGQAGLAVQEHESGGVDVVLLEVKRTSGDTLTVKWQYRNKTGAPKGLTKGGQSAEAYRLSLEAYLIDPANKKKYLILKDDKGSPIAGKHEPVKGSKGVISVAAGQTLSTWAKFPAPFANVEKISVYIPNTQPFEDVPISQ